MIYFVKDFVMASYLLKTVISFSSNGEFSSDSKVLDCNDSAGYLIGRMNAYVYDIVVADLMADKMVEIANKLNSGQLSVSDVQSEVSSETEKYKNSQLVDLVQLWSRSMEDSDGDFRSIMITDGKIKLAFDCDDKINVIVYQVVDIDSISNM